MNTDKKARLRQAAIRDLLEKQEVVTIREFCETLQASVATIRKDLAMLEQRGYLRRVRGGAVSTEGTPRNTVYASRIHLNEREKAAAADQAVGLIEPGMSLILDAGTTCARLAQRILEEEIPCRVWTSSLPAIQILSRCSSVSLISAGGLLDRNHNRFQGPVPDDFHADLYFLSPDGFSQGTATGTDREESLRKQSFVRHADQVVCVLDSSKRDRTALFEICRPALVLDGSLDTSK